MSALLQANGVLVLDVQKLRMRSCLPPLLVIDDN